MPIVERIKIHKDIDYVCRCGGLMIYEAVEIIQGLNVFIHHCDRCDDRLDLDRKYPYVIEIEGKEV